jgi:hypothetical protein
MLKKFCVAMTLLVAITACVGGNDDPGAYPGDYERVINAYLHYNLKDPYSIRDLSIDKPTKADTWTELYPFVLHAWRSCVTYNAKNSYGAYVGIKTYAYYIRNGQVVLWREGGC